MRTLMLITGMAIIVFTACTPRQGVHDEDKLKNDSSAVLKSYIKVVLPKSLEKRRAEFEQTVRGAIARIKTFAVSYGWEKLTTENFMDSVMIFDVKADFDKNLLRICKLDTATQLPATYCAALENRILLAVAPEIYKTNYPEGVEENSYEKLLTHEIAHRLHIRILGGNENLMGPIWFYEGFAIFTAGQLSNTKIKLDDKEIMEVMKNPERASYVKYGYIFRYFANKIPLKNLIDSAKNENFNDQLIKMVGQK